MKRILSARGRVAVSVLVMALLASLSAFYYFNAVPVRSWHMPEVSIVTPSDGEDVTGPVVITATYSVSNGHVHTMRTLIDGQVADSKPAGSQSGTYTFTWNSATLSDGPHTIEVRAYTAAPPSDHFNKETITIHVSNALCRSDADCDDQDDHTQDTCANPGTPNAACVHAPIACLNDAECNDSDPLTLDSCRNAGTSESLCVNTAIQCNNNADCNDSDTHTEDLCMNGGTASAACQYNPIACLNDAECNDSNALTLDSCQNPGMASSACLNQPIACNTNADCNDSDAHTEDICHNGGIADAACLHNLIACLNDNDCNDTNAKTLDVCQDPGIVSSSCLNTAIVCNTSADCDDGNEYTFEVCSNGGAADAACLYMPIACLIASDCDDNNFRTLDKCTNPGTSNASCAHNLLECNNDIDCVDGEAMTLDVCTHPGTANAICTHTAVVCNADADCIDNNPLTIDLCDNAGTMAAACSFIPTICATDNDCDDSDAQTEDTCANPGTVGSECFHESDIVTPEDEPDSPSAGLQLDLSITAPSDNFITSESDIEVTGVTVPGAIVSINDNAAYVDEEGLFFGNAVLVEGMNILIVETCLSEQEKCLQCKREIMLDTTKPSIRGVMAPDRSSLYVEMLDNPMGSGLKTDSISVQLNSVDLAGIYDQGSRAFRSTGLTLEPGQHFVIASVSDKAGNTSGPIAFSIVIENQGEDNANEVGKQFLPMFYVSSRNGPYQVYVHDATLDRPFETGSEFSGSPAFSHKQGVIALTQAQSGNWKISLSSVPGQNAIQVINSGNDTPLLETSMSQDGSTLVYTKKENGTVSLYRRNLTQEMAFPQLIATSKAIVSPTISAHGDMVAFASITGNKYGISLYNIDTGDQTVLASSASGIDTDPQFSPDGQRLYFVSNREGQFDIYRMDLSGADITRVTNTPEREIRPVLHSNGHIYVSIRTNGVYNIIEVDPDSGDLRSVITSDGNDLTK